MLPLLAALLALAPASAVEPELLWFDAHCEPGPAVPFDCEAAAWAKPEGSRYGLWAMARTGGILMWEVLVVEDEPGSRPAQLRR